MSATTDLKACLILELLGAGIPDASVDYECGGGLHRFVVLCRGLRYELSFLERLLDACNAEDITNALRIVVERIQTRAAHLLRSAKRWRPGWLDRIREFLNRPF